MKQNENLITRREALKRAGVLARGRARRADATTAGAIVFLPALQIEYSARAIDLVKRSTVIDMLSVLTLDFRKQEKWFARPRKL